MKYGLEMMDELLITEVEKPGESLEESPVSENKNNKVDDKPNTIRAGYANMFLSSLFSEAFANVTGCQLMLYDTDGSQGAARGAGVGAGVYKDFEEAFSSLKTIKSIEPDDTLKDAYLNAYGRWREVLERYLR